MYTQERLTYNVFVNEYNSHLTDDNQCPVVNEVGDLRQIRNNYGGYDSGIDGSMALGLDYLINIWDMVNVAEQTGNQQTLNELSYFVDFIEDGNLTANEAFIILEHNGYTATPVYGI